MRTKSFDEGIKLLTTLGPVSYSGEDEDGLTVVARIPPLKKWEGILAIPGWQPVCSEKYPVGTLWGFNPKEG